MIRISEKEVQPHEVLHAGIVRESAAECTLFLKRNHDFPVKPCRVNLYGSGARRTVKGGKGSGDVNARHCVSVEEGLMAAGFTIATKEWLDAYDAVAGQAAKEFWEKLEDDARKLKVSPYALVLSRERIMPEYDLPLSGDGELTVYVIARDSSEGMDRTEKKGDFLLLDAEVRDIRFLAGQHKKFVLVLNTGGIVDVSPVLENTENILLLGQLGAQTGNVLADLLTGKSFPSGKLTATWAKELADYPSYGYFGNKTEVDYREGIYVGYRYFDACGIRPLFSFGSGMGYTDFTFRPTGFSIVENNLVLSVEVENIGGFAGREVMQVYFKNACDKKRPFRQLVSFAKTKTLQGGEKEILQFSFDLFSMAVFDEMDSGFILKKGRYQIFAGNCLENAFCVCTVRVMEDFVTERVRKLSVVGMEELQFTVQEKTEETPVLGEAEFCPDLYGKENGQLGSCGKKKPMVDEATKKEIEKMVQAMSEQELIRLCVGVFNDMTLTHNIGSSGKKVAGAAGETFSNEKIPPLVFADGPAGLRISKAYRMDESGNVVACDHALAGILPGGVSQENCEGDYYQYCTAIPVGTALAQSWNLGLCKKMGDIVGKEMKMFGVDFWLAPALNIQRNPLCGRNFEYYSEDPFLSGMIAASVTDGVQQNDGCSVTIKHYCCNNQETDRFFSSSNVSETALREIYLKAFKVCIKNSCPHALMTSYNLVNGVHTANSRELLEDVLRGEWDYDGLVMTDWLSTGGMGTGIRYGSADAGECIAATNDLIMPGREEDKKDILTALQEGRLTRKQLEESAARILWFSKQKKI